MRDLRQPLPEWSIPAHVAGRDVVITPAGQLLFVFLAVAVLYGAGGVVFVQLLAAFVLHALGVVRLIKPQESPRE